MKRLQSLENFVAYNNMASETPNLFWHRNMERSTFIEAGMRL
jgi:hypothetical protein